MKLSTFLLLITVLQVFAMGTYSQSTLLTLDLGETTVKQVLREIENQSEFYFLFNQQLVNVNRKVNLDVTEKKIDEILAQVFYGTDLDYVVLDRQIVISPHEYLAEAKAKLQPITNTGTVTDENGEPLPGVTIVLKGTTKGSVTNLKGEYTIEVGDPSTAILVVSFVGYQTQEISINGRSVVDVILEESFEALDEVVVIGYGTQKQGSVTGSITSVSRKNIKDMPVSRVDQALAGQMAGVQVNQASGAPGKGVEVIIRGIGSITADNAPLYVVDGFPISGDISIIHPSDIESIDVLKDASAAAIYGSRGSNGVVIITTKKGKTDGTKFSLDVYTGLQTLAKKVDVLDGDQFREYAVRARNNSHVQRGGSADDPDDLRSSAYQIEDILATTANTDWQDEVFGTGAIQNYQLSAMGGNEKGQYFVSANYFDQEGIVMNSGFKRYSVRANVDIKFSDRIRGGLSLVPSYSETNSIDDNGRTGVITNSLALQGIFPVTNPDGSYANSIGFGSGISGMENPVALAREISDERKKIRILSNAFAEFDILKGLTFRTSIGTDIINKRNDFFASDIVNYGWVNLARGSSYSKFAMNWLFDNTLTFKQSFDNQHTLTALLGFSSQEETFYSSYMSATGYPNNLIPTLSNATEVTNFSSNEESWSLLSMFARVIYDIKDKYFVTATVRRDGSSRFGENNKWGVFPSVSSGWRISEESFLQDNNFLSDLKLRASWGKAGNYNISNYGSFGLMGSYNYIFGTRAIGLQPVTLENPDLTWEISAQTNIGLDVGLFKDRVYLIADYFVKNTEGLLLEVQVPTTTGYKFYLQNLGEVENRGWEFFLTTINIVNKDFSWKTSLNLTSIKNKVFSLGPGGDPIISGAGGVSSTHITEIGQSIGNFYGYVRNEIYENQADIDANPVQDFENRQPGDWKTEDIDGNGIIDAGDRTITGSPWPDFTYGMTNTFNYKNFDFSFLIVGSQGNEILNLSKRLYGNFAANNNILTEQYYGWQSADNVGNGLPRAARSPSSYQTALSTYHIEDGSYLSVRNITLGYAFNNVSLSKSSLESFRIYCGIQNAFLFTDFLGFNPEESVAEGSALSAGASYGGYPLPRTFTLGINLRF